ncbi:GntR family transcriptional regulator [Desulfosporosinus fructosivorans]
MNNSMTDKKQHVSVIDHRVLRQDIYDYLRDEIINGNLQPGERIVETRIARELNVSQSPIREALRDLELMGLVDSVPYKGTFVRSLSLKDLRDAYKLRSNLEGFAAKEAAMLIVDSELHDLENLCEQMNSAAHDNKLKEFVNLDIKFHKTIVKISGNKLLEKLWQMVHMGQWTLVTTNISKRSLPELAKRHDLVLECLKSRDAQNAEMIIKQHIDELFEDIERNFSSNGISLKMDNATQVGKD